MSFVDAGSAASPHPLHRTSASNLHLLTLISRFQGLRRKRLTGDEYFAVLDEVVDALRHRWPHALLQFEARLQTISPFRLIVCFCSCFF